MGARETHPVPASAHSGFLAELPTSRRGPMASIRGCFRTPTRGKDFFSWTVVKALSEGKTPPNPP
jgi:hypothetical protein